MSKIIKVFQLKIESFDKSMTVIGDDKRLEFVKEALKNNEYQQVIGYVTNSDDYLNEAYRLTNNIDYPWSENFPGSVGGRSTSMCDIIDVDGQKYMVASVGFKDL